MIMNGVHVGPRQPDRLARPDREPVRDRRARRDRRLRGGRRPHGHPPVRAGRRVGDGGGHLGGVAGRAALRAGGRRSGAALGAERGRPAASRLPAGGAPRRSSTPTTSSSTRSCASPAPPSGCAPRSRAPPRSTVCCTSSRPRSGASSGRPLGASVGLVAGFGRLPFELARGARRRGRRVAAVALEGFADPELADAVDACTRLPLGQLERLFAFLRSEQVKQVVLAGKVPKRLLFEAPGRLQPDATRRRAARDARRPQGRLDPARASRERSKPRASSCVPQAELAPELLAGEGTLGAVAPGPGQLADVAFAWPIAKALGALDVGQTVVVRGPRGARPRGHRRHRRDDPARRRARARRRLRGQGREAPAGSRASTCPPSASRRFARSPRAGAALLAVEAGARCCSSARRWCARPTRRGSRCSASTAGGCRAVADDERPARRGDRLRLHGEPARREAGGARRGRRGALRRRRGSRPRPRRGGGGTPRRARGARTSAACCPRPTPRSSRCPR